MNNGSTVDIVEDDSQERTRLAELCETAGYRTRCVASAEDYLQLPPAEVPCCAVVDLRLPGMGGFDLVRHLRRSSQWLPCIAVAGDIGIGSAVRSMHLGAVTVLEKPAPQDSLASAIAMALAISRDLAPQRQLAESLHALTAREQAVLDMLADGEPYKTIAQYLGIGIRTAERIRERILTKTGYSSIMPLIRDVGLLKGLTYQKTHQKLPPAGSPDGIPDRQRTEADWPMEDRHALVSEPPRRIA